MSPLKYTKRGDVMAKRIRIALDEILDSEKITRYEVAKRTGIGYPIVDKYYKNKVVRYDSDIIRRICLALDCTPGDLIQLVEIEDDEK